MKSFFIFILVFAFLGCDKKVDVASIKDKEIFTITNKANNNEGVYLFLKDKMNKLTILSYKLKPTECLQLTASQFDQLEVSVGEGWFSETLIGFLSVIEVCSPDLPVCEPGNYEFLNRGDWIDEYVMLEVNYPNTNDNCMGIEQWMESK